MKIAKITPLTLLVLILLCLPCPAQTAGMKTVSLPKPETVGGKPLMQVLNERKSTRVFSAQKLPMQTLSNMLWAAFGINRPDGRRTAPSAMNRQEIDIYVITADGAYLFDAREHALKTVAAADLRAHAGTQDFVKQAPVNLVFVADTARMGNASPEDKVLYAGADTGFISENVYLYCASEGLATVVRASVDREALAKALGLRPDQKIILAQSVGFPGA
jgi:SagB-type dehydrogenase family enzyme